MNTHPFPSTITTRMHFIYMSIAIIVSGLVFGLIGFIAGVRALPPIVDYKQSPPFNTQALPSTMENMPLSPTVNPYENGVSNTISFTKVNDKIYLKYKGTIISETIGNQDKIQLNALANPDSYPWTQLVNSPAITEDQGHDSIFDFRVLPNKNNFIFIVEWPMNNNSTDFKVFYYDASQSTNKLSNILTINAFGENSPKGQNVPRIDKISADGKYISFKMYSCWNCDGQPAPDEMLLNRDTQTTKRIEPVSYFEWKANGNYAYKEYKTEPCPTAPPGQTNRYANCPIDPQKLPLLNGKF